MDSLRDLLVGRFTGVDQLHASPWSDEQSATVEMHCTAELDGALIVMRITESRSAGSFAAVNILMTDRDTGEVLLYGFDSLGYRPEPPARGGFNDEELVLYRSTGRGHSRIAFTPTRSGFGWGKWFRPSSDQPWQAVVTGSVERASLPVAADAGSAHGSSAEGRRLSMSGR